MSAGQKRQLHNYNLEQTCHSHVFLVDDKMLCGFHVDKKYGDSLLKVRIGEEAYEKEINKDVPSHGLHR